MNNNNRNWTHRILVLVIGLLALIGAGAAHADEGLPAIVVQDAEIAADSVELPAVQSAEPPINTVAGPTPQSLSWDYDTYVSAPGSGNYGNINYADEDILRYSTKNASWAKVMDGTEYGLPASADIDALAYQAINLGWIFYLSFDTPVAVPGLGTVDDSDVVSLTYVLGQGHTWSLYFDGSQHGLTTDGEDIDALDVVVGVLYLSTTGSHSVPGSNGTLKGPDEDVIVFVSQTNQFHRALDSTTMNIAGTNELTNYAHLRDSDLELHYFSVLKAAKLKDANYSYDPVSLSPNDIGVQERPQVAPRSYGVVWDASAHGFPKVDAFDVVRRY